MASPESAKVYEDRLGLESFKHKWEKMNSSNEIIILMLKKHGQNF